MTGKEYISLKETIRRHMRLYYDQDEPEISDYEYDRLMQELKKAEREHPEWVTPDSPSQMVGGTVRRSAGVKVVHRVPMLSIEDVFSLDDVSAWVQKVQEVHPEAAFCVEQKIDGLSLTLRYQNGMLVLAETRGSGYEGEDVTVNARVISDIPEYLDTDAPYLEIRGEVYMTHEDFEAFNRQQEENDKKAAANPRNLAAGTLRQLDPEITRQRHLHILFFNIQDGPAPLMQRHAQGLDALQALGIPVVEHYYCRTADEVLEAIARIGESRENLAYDIDGAVVKIDQIGWRDDFPAGSKYSSGHIAYKYPPEEKVIEMDQILVDVGRTGRLTFTGIFHDPETNAPARLCGTSVSRASLHNQDYINENRIGPGGWYRLYKSGEIIPKLNGCVKEPPEIFRAPEHCPVCGGLLIREPDTADIRCVNSACPAQLSRTISYFTSVGCMNIMGLGETLVEKLIQEGYLKDYSDIYLLKDHRDELIEAGTIGKQKNTDKLLQAIEDSKTNDAVRLLTALGIRNVAGSTARSLLRHYSGIDALMKASADELVKVPDIGPTTAEDIVRFFEDEENRRIIGRLREYGVNMDVSDSGPSSSKLAGLTIVVTGTLPTLGRREAAAMIEQNGGKCTSSVSRKTSLVLAGEAAGSKLTKAQELGIRVISESEFLEMLS